MTTEQETAAVFTDADAKRWHLELNVANVRKIKSVLGIDLLDHERGLARLYGSPMDLADTLWILCESQAQSAGISDEDFGRRLGGDAMDDAARALCQALVNFSPRHQRKALAAAHQKIGQAMERLGDATIERLDEEIEAEIEKRLNDFPLGKSSGN